MHKTLCCIRIRDKKQLLHIFWPHEKSEFLVSVLNHNSLGHWCSKILLKFFSQQIFQCSFTSSFVLWPSVVILWVLSSLLCLWCPLTLLSSNAAYPVNHYFNLILPPDFNIGIPIVERCFFIAPYINQGFLICFPTSYLNEVTAVLISFLSSLGNVSPPST